MKLSDKHPGMFYHVRYEDLVSNPGEVLKKICGFLGIEYYPEVLDFYTQKEKMVELYTEEGLDKYHKSLYNPIKSDKKGIWETQLSQKQIKMADMVAGKYADLMGYQRKYARGSLVTFISVLPFILFGFISYKMSLLIHILPFPLKKRIIKMAPVLPKIVKLFTTRG